MNTESSHLYTASHESIQTAAVVHEIIEDSQ